MKLVESQRPARSTPEELPPYYEYESDEADEIENQEKPATQGETSEAPPQVEEKAETAADTPPIKPEEAPSNSTIDPSP